MIQQSNCSQVVERGLAMHTIAVWEAATARGYRPIRGVTNIAEAVKIAEERGQLEALARLEPAIAEFGHRRQKYLRRVAKGERPPKIKGPN